MRPRIVLASLVLAAAAHAQVNTFIVPSRLSDPLAASTATNAGGSSDYYSPVFWYSSPNLVQPERVQFLWPVADVPVAAAQLRSLAFRRPNHAGGMEQYQSNPAAIAGITLDLSVGPNTVAGHSTSFAANHGLANQLRVFSGTMVLPLAAPGSGAAPFVATIPFSTPFPFVATLGNTLVADLTVNGYAPTTWLVSWMLDAVDADVGRRTDNRLGSYCPFSNGAFNMALGMLRGSPVLGGTWTAVYAGDPRSLPTGLTAIGVLGFRGDGSIWNGVRLPFSVGGLHNCALATSIELAVLLRESPPSHYQWPVLSIPSDPTLFNRSFFDQGLFFDPGANANGLVAGWSSKWTVRSGNLPLGGRLWSYSRNGVPLPPVGTGWWLDSAVVGQFTY